MCARDHIFFQEKTTKEKQDCLFQSSLFRLLWAGLQSLTGLQYEEFWSHKPSPSLLLQGLDKL